MNKTRRAKVTACISAAATAFLATAPVRAGPLLINNTGPISDANVLGAINTAIANVESLYSTGNSTGTATLNVDFTFNPGPAGFLGTNAQPFSFYSYGNYIRALTQDSRANPDNTNLRTALANMQYGNSGTMLLTRGQALLLSNYGLGAPRLGSESININSDISNWNFTGTTTSGQYDAIGAIEHELDELLGIGGYSWIGTGYFGATDLLRYSGPFTPSTSGFFTYLSIDGGVTNLVDFNYLPPGDFGDFRPPCGPTQDNIRNNQYIQNAFNCTGSDEVYSTSSPEYVVATAIGWDPASKVAAVSEPSSITLFGGALVGLAAFLLRGKGAGKQKR